MITIGLVFGEQAILNTQPYWIWPGAQWIIDDEGINYPSSLHDSDGSYFWLSSFRELSFRLSLRSVCLASSAWLEFQGRDVDILLFVNLPPTSRKFKQITNSFSKVKKIGLVVAESPVDRQYQHVKSVHGIFDFVVSYNNSADVIDNVQPYTMPYRYFRKPCSYKLESWRKRPFLLGFSGSNRSSMVWHPIYPKLGLRGMPLLPLVTSGWPYPPSNVYDDLINDGYRRRKKYLRSAAKAFGNKLVIQGRGWDYLRLQANTSTHLGSKAEFMSQCQYTLVIENYIGRKGYVSEKVFDAVAAGSIPLYLGDSSLACRMPACVINLAGRPIEYIASILVDGYFPSIELLESAEAYMSDKSAHGFGLEQLERILLNEACAAKP